MIYVVASEKGGTGKTTTSAAIVSGATLRGKKALAVDLDFQTNLTFALDGDPRQAGIYEAIFQNEDPAACIQRTPQGDLMAGNMALATADTVLQGRSRTEALQGVIWPLKSVYDVIVIDTGAGLNTLLMNALAAADEVIITMHAKILSLQGLYQLADTINNAKASYNPDLSVAGILFTEYNSRTNAEREVRDTITERAAELEIPTFKTTIRKSVSVEEAQIFRESIFEHSPRSNPTRDYEDFLDELKI